LRLASKRGLAQTEGGKHIKLSNGDGCTFMIPRGTKYKDLEDWYVREFCRTFGYDLDAVWTELR
jgi:hypothetical protein